MDPNDPISSYFSKPAEEAAPVQSEAKDPLASFFKSPEDPTPATPPAPAPIQSWEGVTPHIINGERDAKAAQASNPALPPDAPEQGIASRVEQFMLDNANPARALYHGAQALEKHVLDPVLKSAQENIGRPLLEGAIKTMNDPDMKAANPRWNQTSESVVRNGANLLAGPEQAEEFDKTAAGQIAAADKKEIFGKYGAPIADFATKTYGQAPLFVIRGPKLLKVMGDSAVPRLLESMGTGVAMGAADPNMSIGEGAVGAGLLHTAIEGSTTVLSKLFKEVGAMVRAPAERAAQDEKIASIFKSRDAKIADAELSEQKLLPQGQKALQEGQLIGVVTDDGLKTITEETARAPEELQPKALPRGSKPVYAVGTLDEAGNPVLKTSYPDADAPSGQRIQIRPLTMESAQAAAKSGAMVSIANDLSDRNFAGDFREESGALLGWTGKAFQPLDKSLNDALASEHGGILAAAQDAVGTPFKPSGAETRIERSVPKITPVYEGELRLPDEEPPTQIVGYGPQEKAFLQHYADLSDKKFRMRQTTKVPSYPNSDLTIPDAESGAAPTQKMDLNSTRPLAGGDLTQLATVSDAQRIGVKPMFGGGSGGKPPAKLPASLQGPARQSALRVQGPAVPETPAVPSAPDDTNTDPQITDDLDQVLKNFRQLQVGPKGIDKALSLLVGNHLRGPTDLAVLKTSLQAANILQKTQDDIAAAIKKQIAPKLWSKVDTDAHAMFSGRLTPEEFAAKNPSVTAQARQFGKDLMAERDAWDEYFQAKGVIPDDLGNAREHGIIPLYLTRRYLAYALPQGVWAKKLAGPALAGKLTEGVGYILKEMQRTNPTVSPDAVTEEVMRVLNTPDPLAAFRASGIGKPFKALMEKDRDLPGPVLQLLGEINSGTLSMAMTLGSQRAIGAKLSLMEVIAEQHASPTFNAATGQIHPLPDHPSMYSARNMYVTQDIAEAVQNSVKLEASSHAFLHGLMGFIKGNQVALGGLGPHLNSLMGNLVSGTLAGGLDVTRPLKSGHALWRAARALLDYSADPTGKTGFGGITLDAKRMGSDYFGFGHEEIGNPGNRKFLAAINEVFPDNKPQDLWHAGFKLLQKSYDKYRDLQTLGGAGLDWVDRLYRMQSYIALNDKFVADFAKNGQNSYLAREGLIKTDIDAHRVAADQLRAMQYKMHPVIGDLDSYQRNVREAAAGLAARRVNQSFWNPTYVGKATQAIRQSMIGVAAPYTTAAFETWRVGASLPLRAIQERDLVPRLLMTTIAVGGAIGTMQALSGVSDKEIAQARAEIPKSKQTFRPCTFALPWHDDKGRVQLWDWTRQSPLDVCRYMVGSPDDEMVRRVAANFIMTPVDGSLAGDAVQKGLVSAGFIRPTSDPSNTPYDKRGAKAMLQYLYKAGAFPNVAKGVGDAIRRTDGVAPESLADLIGRRKPYEEPLTPGEGAVKALGISNNEPVTTGPGPSRKASDVEFKVEKGELKKDQRRIFKDKTETVAEKREAVVPVQAEKRRLFEQQKDKRKERK